MFTADQLVMVLNGWTTVLGPNPTVGAEEHRPRTMHVPSRTG